MIIKAVINKFFFDIINEVSDFLINIFQLFILCRSDFIGYLFIQVLLR